MARAAASRLAAAASSSSTVSSLTSPHPIPNSTANPFTSVASVSCSPVTSPALPPRHGPHHRGCLNQVSLLLLNFFMPFECIDRGGLCCLSVNWTGRERRSPSWWCPSRSFHGEYLCQIDDPSVIPRLHLAIHSGSSCEISCGLVYCYSRSHSCCC